MDIFEAAACKKCQIMEKRKKEKDRIECGRSCIELKALEFQRFNFARDKQFERCARGKQSKRKYMGENTRRQAFLRDLVCKYTFWRTDSRTGAQAQPDGRTGSAAQSKAQPCRHERKSLNQSRRTGQVRG